MARAYPALSGRTYHGAFFFFKDRKQFFAPFKNRRNVIDLLIYGIAGVSCSQFLYFTTINTPPPA